MDTCIRVVGLPQWLSSKESVCSAGDTGEWVQSLDQEDALEEGMSIMPVFLHVESHGWRSLAGYGPLGLQSRTQLKQLSMHACVCMAESLCCPSETIIPY